MSWQGARAEPEGRTRKDPAAWEVPAGRGMSLLHVHRQIHEIFSRNDLEYRGKKILLSAHDNLSTIW